MVAAPKQERFRSLGLELVAHVWGEPTADTPPIVALHGFADQALSFAPVAEGLASDRAVVALDQRGHGRSERVGTGGYYHFPDYVLDVDAMWAALGLEKAVVVGHSMGASVAIYLAGAFPERVAGLVLLDGIGPPDGRSEDGPKLLRRWVHAVRDREGTRDDASVRTLDELADRVARMSPWATRARLLELARGSAERTEDGWRSLLDPLHRTPGAMPFDGERLSAFLAAIDSPTLLLWGAKTPFKPPQAEARQALIRDLTVESIPSAGHNLHHENPAAVAAAIAGFLRRRRL